ncbi:MAG: winged helix-turn-helix domain-containing protein [Candidatus Acidiferrum sp.]
MAISPHPAPRYRFGIYEALPESGELFRQGQRVKIQEQPFRLLIALLERPGEIVTREALSQRLWPGDTFVEFDQSLGAAVMKLRQTLKDDAENPRFIETIPRRGFRFIAPVAYAGYVASQVVKMEGADGTTAGDLHAERQERLPIRWLTLFLGLACVVAILLAGLWRYFLPVEPPKIVATSQATHDGILKEGLLTDGQRLYWEENRGRSRAIEQASTAGGELVPIPNGSGFAQLQDISPSGSELLITSRSPNDREGETWALGLPNGARRRLSNVMSHGGAWSRDGRQLVFANGPELFLANADGTDAHKLTGTPGIPFGPRFSPDGKRVRFAVNSEGEISTLWEIRTDGTDLQRLFTNGRAPASQCCGAWSADGRYYFFIGSTGAGGNIWALRETSGLFPERASAPVQMTTGLLSFGALAPSPDTKKLYAEAFQIRGELVGYDSKLKQFAPYLAGISSGEVDFSRDAQWITYISYPDRTLWRSRADGTDRLQLTHAPLFAVLPKWSPDGTQIAFAGEEIGKPWRIFVIGANGGTPREVHAEDRSQIDVNWAPDGKSLLYGRITTPGIAFSRIATAGSTEKLELNVVDLNSDGVSIVPGSENLFSPRWSPDGEHIAALAESSKKLMLFDFKTQKWTEWVNEAGNIAFPKWSADSQYVYYDLHAPQQGTSWRIKVGGVRPELVADSTGLQWFISPHVGPWSGLAPDGTLLFVRDLSTDEIYTLELQLP